MNFRQRTNHQFIYFVQYFHFCFSQIHYFTKNVSSLQLAPHLKFRLTRQFAANLKIKFVRLTLSFGFEYIIMCIVIICSVCRPIVEHNGVNSAFSRRNWKIRKIMNKSCSRYRYKNIKKW